MNSLMKKLTGIVATTVVTLSALPFAATPVFAEGGLTCTVGINPDGSTYTECTNTGAYIADPTTDEHFQEVVQQTQQAWEQETGYTYGVNIYEQTPGVRTCQDDGYPAGYYWSESAQACITDYVEPTPAPTPVPTPVPTPTVAPATPTPTATPTATNGTWDYAVVGDKVLSLINEQRVSSGLNPLTVLAQANTDATQRANESMEFAKECTAYGTTTDGHVGFDTEIGDTEVNSYVTHLDSELTAEEVANMIFNKMTSGLGKTEAPFSDQYKTIGLGFVDAHFTNRLGRDLGHNVWFNLQLNK